MVAYLNGIKEGEGVTTAASNVITGTAGEDLAFHAVVYQHTDGSWYYVDGDSTTKCGSKRGIVTESGGIASAATGEITLSGIVNEFTGLTPGGDLYVSTGAGDLTQIKPTVTKGGTQKLILCVGYALSATEIYFFSGTVARYLKRADIAADGTLTVEHYADEPEQSRQVGVFLSTTVSATATEYASSNQDVGVKLKGISSSGYSGDLATTGQAISGGDNGAYPKENAFDDDSGTLWLSLTQGASAVGTAYIGQDFGANSLRNIRRFVIEQGIANCWINSVKVDYSDNNSSWTTAATVSIAANGNVNTYDVSDNGYHRYWRLLCNASPAGGASYGWQVEELQFLEYDNLNDKLAQSFQIASASNIDSVKLWLKKTGSPTGNLTAKIYTDSGDEPNALVSNGTSDAVAASTLTTSYGWIDFAFSTSPSLSATTTYWIVLETADSASNTDYVDWGADASAPGYASGEMKSFITPTWSAEDKDACFQVLVPSTSYDEPASTGLWSLEDELIACRYDDGSGSDPNTKTTFKNKHTDPLDLTCEVRLR